MSEPYLIVGAGAIGAIVGVHLARAGHEVVFVEANAAHRERIRTDGLRLTGALEATIRPEVHAPGALNRPFRQVLLAVKSRHTAEATAETAPIVAADGFVVSLQNGLEEYKIAEAIGAERTIGAYLTFGGFYVEPGMVKFGGTGSFKVGELDGRITPRLERLAADLAALQPVDTTANIFGYLWAKMALGAVYFGTAVVDADVPDIYRHDFCRRVLGRLCRDVVAIADALGVAIEVTDGFDPKAFRSDDAAAQDASWRAQTAYWSRHDNKRTGVWRDLAIHRRKTEFDWLLGPVLDLGRRHGVATPHLARLGEIVTAVENGERPLGFDTLRALDDPPPPGASPSSRPSD